MNWKRSRQFGAELDKASMAQIARGQRMVEVLKQDEYSVLPIEKQISIIFCGVKGLLDDIPVNKIKTFEKEFYKYMDKNKPEILSEIKQKKILSDELSARLENAVKDFKADFTSASLIPAGNSNKCHHSDR